MQSKKKAVPSEATIEREGKAITVRNLKASAWAVECKFCLDVDKKEYAFQCVELKEGSKCSSCGASLKGVKYREIQIPIGKKLWEGKDNRGNPVSIRTCSDNESKYRKGRHCDHPCVSISGTNVNTSSARSHTIHLTYRQATEVVDILKKAIEKGKF